MLEQTASRVHTPRHQLRGNAPVVVLGLAGAAVGFTGSWIPSYWGDEAASVLSASRPLRSLAEELAAVDAVHGLYYSFLHVWILLFGASEVSTRLPSALAVGLMVAGTVVLVRSFAGSRIAILAGICCAVLPRSTWMAVEARSYAMATAAAVWVTVLLVRALREESSARWWVAYALVGAASVYLFLSLGLVLLAHGAFVALVRRRMLSRWLRAGILMLVCTAPVIVVGYQQRHQIAFLGRRGYATAVHVLSSQWFGPVAAAVVGWCLILVAVGAAAVAAYRRVPHADDRASLTVLALLWLVLPTAVLLVANALVVPTYNVRYLAPSTPAAAILIALGIAALARAAMPAWRTAVTVGLAIVLTATCAPGYLHQRTPWAKDGGSDLQAVASFVRDHASPGGIVVFDQSTKPSRSPRLALDLYPGDFTAVTDVALSTPYADRGGLWDRVIPNRATWARLGGAADVWAIELGKASAGVPDDVAFLKTLGYQVESASLIHRTTVYHLIDRR